MRKLYVLILLACWVMPMAAQDTGCESAPPPQLAIGQAGRVAVQEGFMLNLRAEASTEAEVLLQLNNGEEFTVLDGPVCANGLYWWQVDQFGVRGWVAESDGRSYMVEAQALPEQTAVTEPAATLSPVLLADEPTDLQTAVIHWDWAQFLTDTNSYIQAPDPLSLEIPATYQGHMPEVPIDLSTLRFLDDAHLNGAQQALLAQNGFVVVPGDGDVFFDDAYRFNNVWDPETGHSLWVSTDALLNALHISFDNLLKLLEMEELHDRLLNTISPAYTAAAEQWQSLSGSPLEVVARNAAVYYAVALGLLDHDAYAEQVDAEIAAEADPLIQAAMTAEGRLDIPFLPQYQEDFSQYKPRGHYTSSPETEAYFRAMMWLGRITFLTRDYASLQTSLLLLRAMQSADVYDGWATISDLLTFLIGPTDNLGPAEYQPLADEIFGAGLPYDKISDPGLLDQFQAAVKALPGPRINNVVRPIGTQASALDETTRGFRLFGQRFTFDAYAMQRLIYPEVGTVGNERALPSGLDIAAVMGSDLAFQLLDEHGDTAYANYVDHVAQLRGDVSALNATDWFQNVYGGWLWALQPLWARNPVQYPPLMSRDAWLRRDLQAGLASWAELKHDTILYTAQPYGGLGGGGDQTLTTHGMVEPNPLVFARIAVISASVYQLMHDDGFGDFSYAQGGEPPGTYFLRDAFSSLSNLSAKLAEMAAKELRGEALSDDEELMLKYGFASWLGSVRYSAEMMMDPEQKPKMNATVADVASNPDAGTILEVGTGEIDTIYVVTDSPDGPQLTRGVVYSYYEFTRGIDQRLSDEDWRALLRGGEAPPRPDWINSFYSR